MSKRIGLVLALSIAASVAACASHPRITTETIVVAGVGPVEVERLNVDVAAVYPANRTVIVQQGAYSWAVEVPPVFGDLQHIHPGDRLEVRRVEGALLSARHARKGAKPNITYTEAVSEPSFQNLPEKYVVRAVTLTAKFESFDPSSGVVHYVGPTGPHALTVLDPAIRADLGRLHGGDMVSLTFAEAFHIMKI